jgi:hypothetical protein
MKEKDNQLELKLKSELKQELIDYYNKLKSEVNTKSLKLLKNNTQISKEKRDSVNEEKIYLIKQIDRVCDSNLDDLEQLFETLDNNRQTLSFTADNDNESITKNEIKKRILNNYLIFVNHGNYSTKYGGILFEFQWFLDQNQQNFM